jgi:ketosteroid isomerase-like protein
MRQILAVAVLASLGFIISGTERVSAQDNEKSAVEATVRDFEQAFQDYNYAKLNSLLTTDARSIMNSLPEKTDRWEWLDEPKAAGIRYTLRLHDFETHVQGDVAWVTVALDQTASSDSAKGREMLLRPGPDKNCLSQGTQVSCKSAFVESEVLVKTPNGWKIALIHTSRLPKAQN